MVPRNAVLSELGTTERCYEISALNRENLQELCKDLMEIVESGARDELEAQAVSDTDDFIWDEKAKATLDDFDDEDFSDDDYME